MSSGSSSCLRLSSVLARAYSRGRNWRSLTMSGGGEDKEYLAAVERLNGLQTNAAVLDEAQSSRREKRSRELSEISNYLGRIGLEPSDLDRLNAIHVTGTKGKGSVCAMSERILRAYGLKTGFYSSPHLREVRERIRLNGRPLAKSQFVKYFWEAYDQLVSSKEQYDGAMPPYFRFLTVMAFNVFLKEKVDVAVVEVGIGGTFDSTNIIPNPVVCGITSLGLDHVALLGDTLEKIAWQKGGICKPGHPAFTVPQEAGPLRVLQERAEELKALSLEVAPELRDYPGEEPALALVGDFQKMNASLAVQLCRKWLQCRELWRPASQEHLSDRQALCGVPVACPFSLPPQFIEGLRECRWPGRNQVIKRNRISYYIDGAHTPQSIEMSAQWFNETSAEEAKTVRGDVVRVLLFNITGRREASTYLRPLLDCSFDFALFSPNITSEEGANSADMTNLTLTTDKMLDSVKNNERTWQELLTERKHCHKNEELKPIHTPNGIRHYAAERTNGHAMSGTSQGDRDICPQTRVFSNLKDLVEWCTVGQSSHTPDRRLLDAARVQILVTGSLHLAGAVMSVLDFNVDDL